MPLTLTPDLAMGEMFENVDTGAVVSLAPITQALGASYSLLFRTRPGGAVPDAACHGVGTGYVDRLKEASRLQLLPAWLDSLTPGSVVDRTAFGSDQQFARTAFCNHVVRPEGDFHCMIATPFAYGEDRFHLVVGRPRSKHEFDADNRKLLHWMLPHVAEILQLRADLAATRRTLGHAERALDGLQEPVMVVGDDALLISANQAARSLMATREAIWPDGKVRLTAPTVVETAKLRKAIQSSARTNEKTFVVIGRLNADAPLRLTLSRLQEAESTPSALGKVLIVADPYQDVDDTRRIASMARDFGLTRREIDVVVQLMQGRTLKVVARDLGMTYNTARSYVRQVFGKTAVHRQSDLLRLFAMGHRPGSPSGR